MAKEANEKPVRIDARKMAEIVDREVRKGANEARRLATLGYYPTALENLGVGATHLRQVVRGVRREIKGAKAEQVVALAHAIVGTGTLEGRQAAYEIVNGHAGGIEALSRRDVERLGKGMDNWASVDGFSCYVAGQAWRTGVISDADVVRWAGSKDRWWRRAAVVATVPLNAKSRGGTGDTRRTLEIVELVIADRDPMIVKAVSWALRTLIAHDRKAVEKFLTRRQAEIAPLVKREVTSKLTTGRKNG